MIVGSLLLFNYTQAIREQNDIERQSLEQDRATIESQQQLEESKLQSEDDARNQSYALQFRKECESQKDKVAQDSTDFINTCTSNDNTIDYCMATPAYQQIFLPQLEEISQAGWLESCIDKKMSLLSD